MLRHHAWGREGIGVHSTSNTSIKEMRRLPEPIAEAEAGPSRLPMGIDSPPPTCDICRSKSRSTTRRPSRTSSRTSAKKKSSASLLSVLPPFLLPFLPTASAAPPPSRSQPQGTPVITPPPSHHQTPLLEQRRVQYLTSAVTPSPPLASVIFVDETVIPYLLTQRSDGKWEKAEGGWLLYGRRGVASYTTDNVLAGSQETASATTSATASTTATTSASATSVAIATLAVESALPNGWGTTSSRTTLYKVPLIVVASCIIAVAIVALIVFIVITRRRRHRRQKRAKERLRRKALAAAGLSEGDMKDEIAQAAFKEKLEELQLQRNLKQGKGGKGSKGDQVALAKSKVRGWNRRLGLRRRKGAKKAEDSEPTAGGEDDDAESVAAASPPTSPRANVVENDQEDRQSTHSARRSADGLDASSSGSGTPPPLSSNEATSTSPRPVTTPIPATSATHFPPAYRPASVRSFSNHRSASTRAGSSRVEVAPTTHDDSDSQVLLSGPEKTQAPGYYPAPATEDGEIALAIASRSDGKARMIDPPDAESGQVAERAQQTRHIATDDKRVLEQMRLGASAPPNSSAAEEVEAHETAFTGPSAPVVEIDQDGFELPLHGSADASDLGQGSGEVSTTSPVSDAFPPPPPKPKLVIETNPLPPTVLDHHVDERHILPSAPPLNLEVNAPSAPPLMAEDDDDVGQEERVVASAPPLGLDDSAQNSPSGAHEIALEHEARETQLEDEGEDGGDEAFSQVTPPPRTSNASTTAPPLFLPRYEP